MIAILVIYFLWMQIKLILHMIIIEQSDIHNAKCKRQLSFVVHIVSHVFRMAQQPLCLDTVSKKLLVPCEAKLLIVKKLSLHTIRLPFQLFCTASIVERVFFKWSKLAIASGKFHFDKHCYQHSSELSPRLLMWLFWKSHHDYILKKQGSASSLPRREIVNLFFWEQIICISSFTYTIPRLLNLM
jgi:hypothetical protein